jgi:opacity protein-like surface antigen
MSTLGRIVTSAALLAALASPLAAQSSPPAARRPAPAPSDTFMFRGFADVGGIAFTASHSFDAILGSKSGVIFGGGGEIVLPQRIFISVRASRFQKSGSRVFIANGERFDLGIPTDVSITPLEISAGYRFARARSTIIPYAGGGIGWHRYKETSTFATSTEDVDHTFTGYQALGGAEFRATRWIGIAGEAEWSSVPNALGQNSTGVSTNFNETNVGGTSFRVKVVIGK